VNRGVSPSETVGAGWDAVETRRRIAQKDVSVREVLDGAIARTEEAWHLGGVYERTYDRARAEVDLLTSDGPFAGVPTFVKDMTEIRGVSTTWGSRAAGKYVSRSTDPIGRRMNAAGLISLGKSACSELALSATTETMRFPACRNPWDPSRSAGGSSGGAGTLVAAGAVPIAHGTDAGGSIRIPAACCGLVGMKPSRFRLDAKGSRLLAVNVVSDGVLTRSVRDTVEFFAAMEARRAAGRVAPIGDVARAPSGSLRIGVFVDSPIGTPIDPDVRQAVLDAARSCEGLGHGVELIPCPFSGSVVHDFIRYFACIAWLQALTAPVVFHWRFDRRKVEPWARDLAAYFAKAKLAAISAIMRLRRFTKTFGEVMSRYDVLLSPTTPIPAPRLGHLAPDVAFETLLERMREFVAFTLLYNTSGAPAISLPLGRSRDGVPIGVQFGSAHGEDRKLLELAFSIEGAAPWDRIAPRKRWADGP
jgi:amidase